LLFIRKLILDSEDIVTKLETVDLLETVTGSPSEFKAVKEEENKIKEKEENMETQTLLIQQVKEFLRENKIIKFGVVS
jgi:hypothetical protein